MDDARRAWIYSGLALAEGVGLVARSSEGTRKKPLVREILVFGDELARGLGVPLRQLVGSRTAFGCYGRPESRLSDWVDKGWAAELARAIVRPTLVLGAFQWDRGVDVRALGAIETLLGPANEVAWLVPPAVELDVVATVAGLVADPGRLFRSDELDLPLGPDGRHPTTVGYAGWAGAVWAWMT
jgi:hypothetical protein